MDTVEVMFIFLMVFLLFYVWFEINPKIDYNTETSEYLLWYNDPFDCKARKVITLWRRI